MSVTKEWANCCVSASKRLFYFFFFFLTSLSNSRQKYTALEIKKNNNYGIATKYFIYLFIYLNWNVFCLLLWCIMTLEFRWHLHSEGPDIQWTEVTRALSALPFICCLFFSPASVLFLLLLTFVTISCLINISLSELQSFILFWMLAFHEQRVQFIMNCAEIWQCYAMDKRSLVTGLGPESTLCINHRLSRVA